MAYGLRLDLGYTLQRCEDLVFYDALYDAAQLVLLLEHLVRVVRQVLVFHVHQTVLHELHLRDTFCEIFYLFFLDVDVVLLHQLVLRELPFQFLEHLVEIFIEFLLGHLLVCSEYPTFEEVNRELHLLQFLQDSCFGVDTEAVLALFCQTTLDIFFDASAELFLGLRSLVAIYFCEQLSIYLARLHFCFRTFFFVLRDILSEAVGIRLHLLVDHLFGSLDRVLRQFVLSRQFGVELRCYSDVKTKGKGVVVIQINTRSVLAGQRITEDLNLVVLDVLLQTFAYFLVQYVGQDTFAVHLLYQTCRNHSRTETGHLRFLTHLFQLFGYFFLIISRLDRNRYHAIQVFQFTLFNFHYTIILNMITKNIFGIFADY